MRRSAVFPWVAALFCTAAVGAAPPAAAPRAAPAAPTAPAAPEFPPNEAGQHAAAYFRAYGKGEAAMKQFLAQHASQAALKRRSIEDRLETYRDMREERGRLTPVRVSEFTESSVTVVTRAERGGRLLITILCEADPPHAFVAIRVEDMPPDEGTPEGADDAEYSAGPRMSEEQVAAALGTALDSLTRAEAFSGAVLLAKGDRVLLRQGYGLASRRFRVPNRPETVPTGLPPGEPRGARAPGFRPDVRPEKPSAPAGPDGVK